LSGGASIEEQTVSISSLQTPIVLLSDTAELTITEITVVREKAPHYCDLRVTNIIAHCSYVFQKHFDC